MIATDSRTATRFALHQATWRAKRCVRVIGTPDHPTPWDVCHREIDRLLDLTSPSPVHHK